MAGVGFSESGLGIVNKHVEIPLVIYLKLLPDYAQEFGLIMLHKNGLEGWPWQRVKVNCRINCG